MVYATDLTKSSGAVCNCATEPLLTEIAGIDAVSAIGNTQDYPIVIDQGVPFSLQVAFISGDLSGSAASATAGANGVLTFSSSEEICVTAGDKVRVIGYDKCKSDINETYTVGAVDNAAKTIELTGFNVAEDKTFTAEVSSSVFATPLGCVGESSSSTSETVKVVEHIDPNAMVISGGASARSEYFDTLGLEFTSNSDWAISRTLDRVKPGDSLISTDAGITQAVRVLEVRRVETSANGYVDRIRMEVPAGNTGCFLTNIRRGLLFPFQVRTSPAGNALEVFVGGLASERLQLHKSWAVDEESHIYRVGRYSIAAHWGEMSGTQMIPRSKSLLRGDLYIRATHLFETSM